MQGAKFLYFLQNEAGQFYWMNGDNMELSSVPTPLQFTPDGWQEITILTEQNKKYFGLSRTYGAPQNFVEDGATILKTLFYTRNIEEKVYLLILEQALFFNDTEYGFYYKLLCKCQVDLSSFSHSGPVVNTNILEGDLVKMLAANEGITYELPLDVPEAITVKMDGLKLLNSSNYTTIDCFHTAIHNLFQYSLLWLPVQFISNDGAAINAEQGSTDPVGLLQNGNTIFDDNRNAGNWFFHATSAVTVTIKLMITMELTNGTDLHLYIKNSNGTRVILATITNPSPGSGVPFDQVQTFVISQTLTLAADEKLYLISQVQSNPALLGGTGTGVYKQTTMSVSYASTYKTTLVKALQPLDALKALVSKMSGGKYTASSSLFNTDKTLPITSGDGVRSLAGAVIKTSFDDFFQSYNTPYGIGMQIIDNVLVIEKKSFFVNPAATMPLGEGSGLKASPATDYFFSSVIIGYPNQDYNIALGDTNGRGEFNMTHSYSSPITVVNTQLDLTSKYRADMYGIEFTRINLDGKTTSDSSSDNDVFFLKVKGQDIDGNYLLDRSLNASTTGLIDSASAFNIPISPKACLLAHGDYLHSCLDGLDSKQLVFTTSDKPALMVVNGRSESDNVNISDLAPRIFRPWILETTVEAPDDYVDQIAANPIRRYNFTYKQGTVSLGGFAVKTGIAPNDSKEQVYQLLAAPDADLTQLINVYE